MWTLAAPLWLAAGLALALPIVIHLLGRGRGRRVRVGSVRWIPAGALRRARTLRPHHPLLFLVRCLLLAAVGLALAEPRTTLTIAGGEGFRTWVLVHPEILDERQSLEPQAPELYRELDALLAAGAQRRLLSTRLPRAEAAGTGEASLWSLVREADAEAPMGVRFELFSPARQSLFRGQRPRLAREVGWRTVRVREVEDGAPRPAPAGTAPRVDLRYDAERAVDGRYVAAGLRAAARGGPATDLRERPLDGASESDRVEATLEIRLSPRPPPAAVRNGLAPGSLLLTDAGERHEALPARLEGAAWPLAGDIRLHRLGADEVTAGALLWRDTRGRPVLLGERVPGGGLWLRFRSRFHPAWSELVLDPAFPQWLDELVRGEKGALAAAPRDPRQIPGEVAVPGRLPPPDEPRPRRQWPQQALWVVAAGLLPIERWLATRRAG